MRSSMLEQALEQALEEVVAPELELKSGNSTVVFGQPIFP
jgi:hypothetical protein